MAFVIYQSGKMVQNSYHMMMERVLLFKHISNETQENLLLLNSYILDQNNESYEEFNQQKERLIKLSEDLDNADKEEVQISNYTKMINSYLDAASSVVYYLNRDDFESYLIIYDEAEKIAGFIQEDGQQIVDSELSYYEPIYRDIRNYSETINQLGILLFIIATLLSIVFAIWMSRSITIPINRLVDKARQISKGNLEIETEDITKTNDEMGILGKAFHQMLKDLKHYIAENIQALEKTHLVKELELKALQSQINPHFLFNTLNIIANLAYIEGAEKTSDLTASTSNLIRYNLRKLEQPVTLKDEVEHIKEYLTIQKARFQERVSFEFDIDESVLEQLIPCLTLQPILENAFVHGIEDLEQGGKIMITMKDSESSVLIQLSDNGNGMDEPIRKRLVNFLLEERADPKADNKKSTGLGTINVFKRLYLFYGEKMNIEITSNIGVGTTVIFKLPKLPMNRIS